jgi:uncharacterized protein (DUF58 family)
MLSLASSQAEKGTPVMLGVSMDRFQEWLSRDYLPFLRPYLRWTRQPVTWLLVAMVATLLCGFVLQPMAIILSAWIAGVIILGVCWPWIAMQGVTCRMKFSNSRTTEGEAVIVTLTLLNRWPWPLWGLAIVGGFRQFVSRADSQNDSPIETALAVIPAWSESTFHWKFVPVRRGCYPTSDSFLTTGFPFGLWQSRRLVTVENSLVAWPGRHVFSTAMPEAGVDQIGLGLADRRAGDAGDCLGVRPYRRGDPSKRVHWPQTARHGRLIVREHQAAASPAVRIIADLRGDSIENASVENPLEATIRAAASLCESLHRQHARVEYCDAAATFCIAPGNYGLEPVLDHLAMVPYEGLCNTTAQAMSRRVDHRHEMLEIGVTADRGMASRRPIRSRATRPLWIVVGDDRESLSRQWEEVCREV